MQIIDNNKFDENRSSDDITVTSQYKEYIRLLIHKYEKDLEVNLISVIETRSQGDLKENSAYHQARDNHDKIENDIKERTSELSKKEYADKDIVKKEYIDFGAEFTIEINNKSCTYLMLDDPESNFEKNIISRQSPIGNLFLGKKLNDIINFPNKVLNYAIKINRGKIERNNDSKAESLVIKQIKYNNLNNLYTDAIAELNTMDI